MNCKITKEIRKKVVLLAAIIVVSGVIGGFLQNKIMNVSADIKPLVVGVTDMSFGIVFPGEEISGKTFTISLASGETEEIKYKIVKQRADANGDECESDPDTCLPDLCDYITPVLVDSGETDTVDDSSLDPVLDSVDTWKINLDVPAIEGNVAQSFVGTPTKESGLHGCRVSVQIDGYTPPVENLVITNTRAESINNNGANVLWDTNLDSDSRVVCSKNSITDSSLGSYPNYGYSISTSTDSNLIQIDHSMILTGLDSNTTYYCRAISETSTQKAISGEISFTTSGSNPVCIDCGPVRIYLKINNEKVINITKTSAEFTWLTNLSSDSRVVCSENETWEDISGKEPNYGYDSSTATYDITTRVTDHEVSVDGLKPNTKYSCRVISSRGSEEVTSSELDFKTEKESDIIVTTDLRIFDLTTDDVTKTSFDSSWKTNKDATTCVVYGLSSILSTTTEPHYGYAFRTGDCDDFSKQSTDHAEAITGLESCTNYYYRVIASNGVQKAISPEQIVKTLCENTPPIYDPVDPVPQVSDPVSDERDEDGEVKEAETQKEPDCSLTIEKVIEGNCVNACIIWLLVLVIVLLILYIWKKREDEKRKNRIIKDNDISSEDI